MAVAQQVFISPDCSEPAPLASFWAAMPGGAVAHSRTEFLGDERRRYWIVRDGERIEPMPSTGAGRR